MRTQQALALSPPVPPGTTPLRDAGYPCETATGTYMKPAVLQLDLAIDLAVSMAQNCRTAQSTNVGSTPCRTQGGGRGCRTIGG